MRIDKFNRQRLAECREKLGLTKTETATRANLTSPVYFRFESGERNPSVRTLEKIASVLNTSVEYLTDETDDASPNSYYVYQKSDEQLFLIIDKYKKSDDTLKQRIYEYVTKL